MTRNTILLLHDFACGGDVWSDFAGKMEARGWRCEAPTLFHHLRTIGTPPDVLSRLCLSDYVRAADDYARRMADDDGAPPIVVGHGMGALIAQKLLERNAAAAGVCISPFAPADCGPAFSSTAVAFANILLTPASERRASPVKPWRHGAGWGGMNCLDKPQRNRFLDRLRHEPGHLVNELLAPDKDPTGASCIDEIAIETPMLIITGERDRITPPALTQKVADKYARASRPADHISYAAFGHWLIAGAGLSTVVDQTDIWLAANLLDESLRQLAAV